MLNQASADVESKTKDANDSNEDDGGCWIADEDDNDDCDDDVVDYRRTWQKMAFLAAAEVITGTFVFVTPWVRIQF